MPIRDLHLPTNVGSGPEREFAVNSQECRVFFRIVIAFLGNVEPSFYPRKGLQFEDLLTHSLTAMPYLNSGAFAPLVYSFRILSCRVRRSRRLDLCRNFHTHNTMLIHRNNMRHRNYNPYSHLLFFTELV